MSEKAQTSSAEQAASSPLELDLSAPEVREALAKAPLYEKFAKVNARPARAGEVITTILANGSVETSNVAQEGDMIITNPSGEEYITRAEIFPTRYKPTEESGIFQATGLVKALPNPTGREIQVQASWGGQTGDVDCMLTARFDPTKPEDLGPGRIIALQEFQETYRLVQEAGDRP